MAKKLSGRARAKIRIRKRLSGTAERPRISVYRSTKHTYAQAISDVNAQTIVGVSTKDADVIAALKAIDASKSHNPSKSTKSVLAARALGLVLGKKMIEKGHTSATFDRNGFIYHGRISAVADGAREAGLQF